MTTTETLRVPEIHCDHCKSSIEEAVAGLAGVTWVAVDVERRSVQIGYDPDEVERADVIRAIENQGYSVPPQ